MDKKYVGMSVTPAAREAFRRAQAMTTGTMRRQVGVSQLMIIMSLLTTRHQDEVAEMLKTGAYPDSLSDGFIEKEN